MAIDDGKKESTAPLARWSDRTRKILYLFGTVLLIVGFFGYFLTIGSVIEDYVEAGMPIFWLLLIIISLLIITTGAIGKGRILLAACIFILIVAVIQIPISNQLANPPHEGPPMILSWNIQSGTRDPVLWVNAMDVNDDVTTVIVELRNRTSGIVYSNTSYTIVHTQALAPHFQDNISLTLNLTDLGVPVVGASITVKILLKDESGKYSSSSEEVIQVPS